MEPQEKSPSPLTAQSGETPGIGMSLKEVGDLLATTHKTIVPQDDAILMIATLLNAYLSEVQKLHARHEQGLSRLMAEKTDAYVSGVKAAVEQLSASLSSASAEGVRKIFEAHAATLNAFRYAVFWAAAVVSVSALLNVAVFVLRGLR
jgi:hypothetical protein